MSSWWGRGTMQCGCSTVEAGYGIIKPIRTYLAYERCPIHAEESDDWCQKWLSYKLTGKLPEGYSR